MRRWALLLAGGAVWLLLAAVPVLADGGPHVAAVNNGTGGINADSCAGCHRAHTAQAVPLLVEEEPALCLTCHGASSAGATTNVANGVQYTLASDGGRGGVILGALRGGGFETAAIGSDQVSRYAYLSGSSVRELSKVPVKTDGSGAIAGQAVTSVHMDITAAPAPAVAWGNGAVSTSASPGGTMTLECTSCHNPHGNGQYRILNPIPGSGETNGTFTVAATAAPVTDAPAVSPGDVRNYTVIQTAGPSYLLTASQVATGGYANTTGDYFHRKVPWSSSSGGNDAPNGDPANFNTQITAWCSQCHTRYLSTAYDFDTGDSIYKYRHGTSRVACTTCHVAHGSNAQMTGFNSTHQAYPGGTSPTATAETDSRLLKIDNRGTCQACHDPTGTVTAGTYVGPLPTPGVP